MRRTEAAARLVRGWEHGFPGGTGLVLGALTAGYRGLLGARQWLWDRGLLRPRALDCPIVSIGNLTVGGTGKTPAVELAVRTLAGLGERPAVVSRGYRRRARGAQVVADRARIRLDAEEAGDEPFLLARRLPGVPVVVGSNRYEAARLARAEFSVTAIVLDDAFQHRTLQKDLEVVMARARNPWGNGRLLPLGPLREPLASLARADLVVAVDDGGAGDAADVAATMATHAPGIPLLAARYVPVECAEASGMRPRAIDGLAGARLLAFAGIAWPAAFARTLEHLGVETAGMVTYADHHWYSSADLGELDNHARALGAAGLVTTEKDWVRLRRLPLLRSPLYVIRVRLELTSGHDLWRQAFERVCRRP